MFQTRVESAIRPGFAHGASLALHGAGAAGLALAVSLGTPEIGRRPHAPAAVWLAEPRPAAPVRARTPAAEPRDAAARGKAVFTAPVAEARPRELAPAGAPEIELAVPGVPLPPAILAPVQPPVRTEVFGGMMGAAGEKPRPAAVATGVFGSAAAAPAGPRTRAVAQAGFDGPPERAGPPRGRAAVASAGFGDAAAPAAAKVAARLPAAHVAEAPVEILSKPLPAYTEEARRRRIEGEVILEVRFGADGRIEVLRIAQGLCCGLEEQAVEAARRIRFRPARRNGQPVDFAAVVAMRFQLAY